MTKLKLIFLVDDNEMTQFISLKSIELSGEVNEVRCFKNAQETLQVLLSDFDNLPELILLDLNMPVMNGWEFIKQFDMLDPAIKQHTKICILTSSLNQKEKESFKDHPAVLDYIVKPMTVKKFISILNYFK